MKSRFPLAAIFVNLEYNKVDVNVHPSKREIRFVDHQRVYRALTHAIRSSLSKAEKESATFSAPVKDTFQKQSHYYQPPLHKEATNQKVEQPALEWGSSKAEEKLKSDPVPVKQHVPDSVFLKMDKPMILGQVMGTYIVAENNEGLMVIDQHAAHERIVYERLKIRYNNLDIIRQDLLVPETLELSSKEAALLSDILADLASLGILVEPFGGNTFVVKSIPSIIDEKEIKPIVVEIVENLVENKNAFSKENWLDDCLILMACHSAIRANKKMDVAEMETLIMELENCSDAYHCPHGRPTIITWDKDQMEKLFKRVV